MGIRASVQKVKVKNPTSRKRGEKWGIHFFFFFFSFFFFFCFFFCAYFSSLAR